jgi:hypothetical protein
MVGSGKTHFKGLAFENYYWYFDSWYYLWIL